MKFSFYVFETKVPAWVASAREEFVSKINPFVKFEILSLKSPAADRDSRDVKLRKESEILLKQISDRDLLVLFDEGGKLAKSSQDFVPFVRRAFESGKPRVVFCIGGPYGFSEDVKERADALWSLSPLTMNHWLAQLVAAEQVYRAFTLMKNIPYHN